MAEVALRITPSSQRLADVRTLRTSTIPGNALVEEVHQATTVVAAQLTGLATELIPERTQAIDLRPQPTATERIRAGRRPASAIGGEQAAAPHPVSNPTLADRLRILLDVPIAQLLPSPLSVIEWPAPLHPYQLDGVRTLLSSDRLLLADDMGLGKTIQVIAAVRILALRRSLERILLVVPASLLDQWRRELYKWAPELRVILIRGNSVERSWQWRAETHVTLVSYETLRSDFTDSQESPPRRHDWDLVVLDEAQKIKNPLSETSRECKLLRRKRSWALTGTPLENSIDDLRSILEYVYGNGVATVDLGETDQMLESHKAVQLRRRKADVLAELPPKQVIDIRLALEGAQQYAYHRAESEGVMQLKEKGTEVRINHVLALILRLKQLCNFEPVTGTSAKVGDIAERMETLTQEGHRALLFSQFTDSAFGVAAAASALARFQPLTYTGDLSSGERDAVIRRFQANPEHRVLVLSLRAGGVGLNLQHASYVFHLDRWWNPAAEHQADARSHRMGQSVPVTVFKYTTIGTIEERIEEILAAKQQLFDELVDDVSMDLSKRLTAEELFGLFSLEAPVHSALERGAAAMQRGLALEERAALLLRSRGWEVETTPMSRDGGVDLIARRVDEVGITTVLYVQCKDHARPVGVVTLRELVGVLPPSEKAQALVVAPAGITVDAARFARDRGVIVWDEARLAELESS